MGILEIVMIGIGLSMDAVAVSMSNGMVYKWKGRTKTIAMPLLFGFFQALMPVLGYYAGSIFAVYIETYAGIVTLLILGIIGGKMIKDGFCHRDDEKCVSKPLTYKILLAQAVATSIDAFAVGVSFVALGADIWSSAGIIGITTFICSFIAIFIGKKFGDMLGCKAEILGGVILVVIGIKALF